ncbi:MAG: UTP--glucose-1-phosphate uridylyltransferase [Actinomycetia bacterium]|nr:UTP--glucose-1-phosphate uridylyltransferase [Actinomycetes bacterium]
MTHQQVTKSVIPAAGLGTRFLPATKAVPKEMLPVFDAPAIEYVVRESVAAGLDDVLLISGRGKEAIENHFDRNVELEQVLTAKGDQGRLDLVRETADLAHIHSVRQGQALGLGHAVLMAAEHVGSEPFAVLLGDDLIDVHTPVLEKMLAVRAEYGGSVICLMEVPHESISLYGCVAIESTDSADVVRVTDLVEKPPVAEAPSDYAVIGRYVLDPAVFAVLRDTEPGRGGEIQLTDALQTLAKMPAEAGGGVTGLVFSGNRFDTGDKLSYLKAVVTLAGRDPDLGADFNAWLRDFTAE